jgi:hypothetical protein
MAETSPSVSVHSVSLAGTRSWSNRGFTRVSSVSLRCCRQERRVEPL